MSLTPGQLHTHVEDGGIYRLTDPAALMKHPDTGDWLAAVFYEDADPHSPRYGQTYATTEARWVEKFCVWRGAAHLRSSGTIAKGLLFGPAHPLQENNHAE